MAAKHCTEWQHKTVSSNEHCSLDNFDSAYLGADPSLGAAHVLARGFAINYPLEPRGLLLEGSIGTGKTHLAVGALKAVIADRGAQGLFCDYRELLRMIQNSYNPQVSTTELEILNPVMNAEVLVLDDLGAIRPTEWVWDTVSVVLNSRYNNNRTTIITTNYPALAPGAGSQREETLGDRIGERMRSRLIEMCNQVEMAGEDFRQRTSRPRPVPVTSAIKVQVKAPLARTNARKPRLKGRDFAAAILANLTSSCVGIIWIHNCISPNCLAVQSNRGKEYDAWNPKLNVYGKGTAKLIYGSGVSGFKLAAGIPESDSPALAPSDSAAGQSGGW